MPETPQNNPTGFWESQSLGRVNDEILASLDGSWDVPPRLEPGWLEDRRLDALRTMAPDVVNEVFRTKQWAWKDPRNCLTLPFWLDVLDVTPVVVLVHRSPVEVAMSLLWRNGLHVHHSLALWERYVRSSVDAAAGLPTYVIDYAQLLRDPIAATANLHRFLEARGFEVNAPDEGVLRSFLSSELRHSRFSDPETWAPFAVSPEQRLLHAALFSGAGPHDAFSLRDVGLETPAAEALFRALRDERGMRHVLQDTIRGVEGARAAFETESSELRRALETAVATFDAAQVAAAAELARLGNYAAALEHRLSALEPRLSALEPRLSALEHLLSALEYRLSALERSRALRLLTAPGRLRSRVRSRARVGGTTTGHQPSDPA
jgi:hypothetical protein